MFETRLGCCNIPLLSPTAGMLLTLYDLHAQEYFKAVKSSVLHEHKLPIYHMVFPGPAIYAKLARGEAAR